MDGLALLCNLHADGPLTLRRLRRAGIRKLGHLQLVPEETLVGILEANPSHVRRFVREARLLAERVYETPVEEREAGTWIGREQAPQRPVAPRAPRLPLPPPPHGDPLSPSPERTAPRPRIAGDEVPESRPAAWAPLERPRGAAPATAQRSNPSWAGPGAEPLPAPARPAPPARPTSDLPQRAGEPVPLRPTPAGTHVGTRLRPGIVAGLDAGLVHRLGEAGIETVEAFVGQVSLGLARRVGVPFTRLLDLELQARDLLHEARRDRASRPLTPKIVQPAAPLSPPLAAENNRAREAAVPLRPTPAPRLPSPRPGWGLAATPAPESRPAPRVEVTEGEGGLEGAGGPFA